MEQCPASDLRCTPTVRCPHCVLPPLCAVPPCAAPHCALSPTVRSSPYCALPSPCQNQTHLARQQAVQPLLCVVQIPAASAETNGRTAPRPPAHFC